MPVLTSPPLVGGAGKPVTGRVAIQATAPYQWTGSGGVVRHVTTVPQAGVIRSGQFYELDGTTPIELVPTPDGVGMRIVLELSEHGATRGEHKVSRVVRVPDTATIEWAHLADVVPPVTGEWVVPPWAATIFVARDEAEASATSALASATSAANSEANTAAQVPPLVAAAMASDTTIADAAVLAMEDAAVQAQLAWVKAAITTAVDLDTFTTSGVRPISSGIVASLTNKPADTRTATAELYVAALANAVIHQEYRQYEATTWRRWERARVSGTWRAWVDITPGGAPAPAPTTQPERSSMTSVTCIGDSLTDGYSNGAAWAEADSYPSKLATFLGAGVTVTNRGFSGSTTDQINTRIGANPLEMKIPGGSIPASGPVTVTSSQVIGAWGGTVSFNAYGWLDGIYGILSYTEAGGYTFTRGSSGTAVTATRAEFVGEFKQHATDTIVYFAGRNDITKGTTGLEPTIVDHVMRGYSDVMLYATPRRKQVALLGTITRTDEAPGSPGFEAVKAIRERLRELYPAHFLDVQAYLTGSAVWADTGISPTQADLGAQALGKTPPSLFDDVTHYNRATAEAIATKLVGPFLKGKGWV